MEDNVNNVATRAGVDPAVIIAILTAIAQIVSQFMAGCQPKPTAADVLKMGHTVRGKLVIFRAMQQNDVRPLSATGRKVYAELVAEAPAVADSDAGELLGMN